MAWGWYGVKTLFRIEAKGRPHATDRDYDSKGTLVEERIILVRARSHREAIWRAESEARRYASDSHVNPYGQTVRMRYLEGCDSYELFHAPRSVSEVFSSTYRIPESVSDNEVCERFLGPDDSEEDRRLRKRYLNREFSGQVRPDT